VAHRTFLGISQAMANRYDRDGEEPDQANLSKLRESLSSLASRPRGGKRRQCVTRWSYDL